jgi:hypothetical protein
MTGFVDHAKGARVLLDGQPGTIVRSYVDEAEPGYDVDLDNGEARWVSHRSSRNRLKDLPREQDPHFTEIDWYALSNGLSVVMPDGTLIRGADED